MKPFMKHAIATTLLLAVVLVAAFAIFVQSGVYNFAADAPHIHESSHAQAPSEMNAVEFCLLHGLKVAGIEL